METMMTTNSNKTYDMRGIETSATTVIEPVGDLTPALSMDLQQTVRAAAAKGRTVEISMRRISHVSWAGLSHLATTMRDERVRFRSVLPRIRSLMQAAGFERHRIVD